MSVGSTRGRGGQRPASRNEMSDATSCVYAIERASLWARGRGAGVFLPFAGRCNENSLST